MKTKNMKGMLFAGAFLALVGITMFVWQKMTFHSPAFHMPVRTGAFAELISVPPTSAYGSSIHVWVYDDENGEPQEIAVTGHADAHTCTNVSRILFSTAIQKNSEPEDLLVAGAARLRRHENPAERARLESLEPVRSYMESAAQLQKREFVLLLARSVLLDSSKARRSALEKVTTEFAALEKEVSAAEQNADVKAYLRETRSGVALPMLIREAKRLEAESGLVHVHHIPLSVATEVRDRVRRAAVDATGAPVSFNDLLKKVNAEEGAVLVNVVRTRSGEPVSLALPREELSEANYEEVRKLNRGDIDSAMIGDARERLTFYKHEHANVEGEIKSCSKLSAAELDERIRLDTTCTAEGICVPADPPTEMTRREYCATRVPLNLRIVNQWTKDAEQLMQDITDDVKRDDESHAEAINYATLVDSMLRDWDLPVARDQRAFDVWRKARRNAVWRRLSKQLRAERIDASTISGENVVFAVRASKAGFAIQPVAIVDLRRSILVAAPSAGATRVVNTWEKRERKTLPPPDDRARLARNLSRRAIELAQSSPSSTAAREVFRQAFAADPRAAAFQVMTAWKALLPPQNAQLKRVRDDAANWAKVNDFNEEFAALIRNPEAKESGAAFLRRLRTLLKANPDAPPEFHLALALQTATLIQKTSRGGKASEGDAFDALLYYSKARPSPTGMQSAIAKWESTPDEGDMAITEQHVSDLVDAVKGHIDPEAEPYIFGRLMTAAMMSEDPAVIIEQSTRAVRSEDSDFWQRSVDERGIPAKPSKIQSEYEEQTEHGRDPVTREAIALVRMCDLLRAYDLTLQAADHFFAGGVIGQPDGSAGLKESADMIDAATTNLDAAAHLKTISGDPELGGLRDHVRELKRASQPLDTLTRVELGTKSKVVAERVLSRAEHLAEDAKELSVYPDHSMIDARIAFENGSYDKALARLFEDTVPIALSSRTIRWMIISNAKPDGSPVRTRQENGSVVVFIASGNHEVPVLRIEGYNDATTVAAAIEHAVFEDKVTLWPQILLVKVPLEMTAARFRRFVTTEPQKSILLKAIVYGCAGPGLDLIPRSERCEGSEIVDKSAPLLADVVVPTLDSLRQSISAALKGHP